MKYTLRDWKMSDADSVVKHANNYNVAKWLTDQFPHPYGKADAEAFIESVSNNKASKIFAIDVNGEAVGSIGVFPQADIHKKSAEIGYWLSEDYWGNGIISKAIEEVADYAFKNFDVVRVFARPFSTNKTSQRVLEKAGFKLEAILKKALFKNGEYMDEYIFYKLKD